VSDKEGIDESYWKGSDGKVNDDGHALADVYKQSLNKITYQQLSSEGYCACCLNPADRIARKLTVIALIDSTGEREDKVPVVACPVCDAGLLENARRQHE
jgi:hypothetical protein